MSPPSPAFELPTMPCRQDSCAGPRSGCCAPKKYCPPANARQQPRRRTDYQQPPNSRKCLGVLIHRQRRFLLLSTALPVFVLKYLFPQRLPSIGATATTAAGGGNRESLLGQRPARRKCFLKHKADAGGRNPALSAKQTERLQKSPSHSCAMGFCRSYRISCRRSAGREACSRLHAASRLSFSR